MVIILSQEVKITHDLHLPPKQKPVTITPPSRKQALSNGRRSWGPVYKL